MLSRNPNGSDHIGPIPLPQGARFDASARATSAPASPSPAAAVRKSPFEGMKCEGAVLIGAGAKVAGDISNSSTVEI